MRKNTVFLLFLISLFVFPDVIFGQKTTERVELSFVIEPIFMIRIISEDSALDFGSIDNSQKGHAIKRRVEIEILSNIGTPYHIMQRIEHPVTDQTGYALPDEFTTFRLMPSKDTKGRIEILSSTKLVGENLIFTSTPDGKSDRFIIIYEFKSPGLIKAGQYNTAIIFTALR